MCLSDILVVTLLVLRTHCHKDSSATCRDKRVKQVFGSLIPYASQRFSRTGSRMESLVEPRCVSEASSEETSTVMSGVLPVHTMVQDSEPSSMTPERKGNSNFSTTPPVEMNDSLSVAAALEATSGESSMPPQTVDGTPPPQNIENTARGVTEERRGDDDGSSAITVEIEEDENESESGSSEVSDGEELNVYKFIVPFFVVLLTFSD